MTSEISLIVVSVAVILWCIHGLDRRRRIQRARKRGLWPPRGQFPTLEDLKRLAQGGEKRLAIRLCREICGVTLTEAMRTVHSLVPESHP